MIGGVNQDRIDRTLARQNEHLANNLVQRINQLSCWLLCCTNSGEYYETLTLTPGWDVIVLNYDIPIRILRKPDIYPLSGVSLKWVEITPFYRTLDNLSINDSQGFPLKADVTYGYQVVDAIAATYACSHVDYTHFIEEQAKSALIQVASQFPYDSDGKKRQVLRVHSPQIEARLKTVLQEFVKQIGIQINYFQIRQIQYGEELQHYFLERQRAQAFIIARNSILDASFGVIEKTIQGAEQEGRPLTREQKVQLTTRLLLLNCTPSVELKLINGSELPSYLAGLEDGENPTTNHKES